MKSVRKIVEPHGYISVSKKHRIARIRDEIIREVKSLKIPYVVNAKTVLLFNPDATPEEILASLDVLRQDIKLRITEAVGDTKHAVEEGEV